MKTKKYSSLTTITVSLIALLGTIAPACSSDSDGDDDPIIGNDAGLDAGGGNSGSGGSGNTSGDDDGGVSGGGTGGVAPGDGGTDPDGGGGDSGVIECPNPLGEDGCFNCPTGTEEFLNRCTESDCEPFDNAARLPHLNDDGTLPPLP